MAIFKKTLTEEEAKKFSEENKLNSEALDSVNGGYVFYYDTCQGWGYWRVVNDETGEFLGIKHLYKEYAMEQAAELGQSSEEITEAELWRLCHQDYYGPFPGPSGN